MKCATFPGRVGKRVSVRSSELQKSTIARELTGDKVAELSSIGISVGMLGELRFPKSILTGKSERQSVECSGLELVSSIYGRDDPVSLLT
jgi:hypothetical protein